MEFKRTSWTQAVNDPEKPCFGRISRLPNLKAGILIYIGQLETFMEIVHDVKELLLRKTPASVEGDGRDYHVLFVIVFEIDTAKFDLEYQASIAIVRIDAMRDKNVVASKPPLSKALKDDYEALAQN